MFADNVWFAFGLTLFAGLATGIGSLLALVTRRSNACFLSAALGFSAGVMIYVSLVEIFAKARATLVGAIGEPRAYWYTTGAFFGGMLLIALIDKFVPSGENPHEARSVEEIGEGEAGAAPGGCASLLPGGPPMVARQVPVGDEAASPPAGPPPANQRDGAASADDREVGGRSASGAAAAADSAALHPARQRQLLRMGWFSALAIAIHNFPEGLATFTAALKEPHLGVGIAIAIAIHNIPEGIAVSVPVYFATGSRRQAFVMSFLSGLAEPLGALVGYWLLRSYLDDVVFGIIFAGVAGIMVFISLDELLPTAEKYGEHHIAIYGVVSGMAVMALSLLLFAS